MQGQTVPEIETLAAQTAGRVAKSQPKRVFIGMRQGCILDTRLCENLDSDLRTLLGAAGSGIQFSSRDDVVSILNNRGFLSIDAYVDFVLRANVSGLEVEVLVINDLAWKGTNYELSSKIIDVGKVKSSIPSRPKSLGLPQIRMNHRFCSGRRKVGPFSSSLEETPIIFHRLGGLLVISVQSPNILRRRGKRNSKGRLSSSSRSLSKVRLRILPWLRALTQA